MERLVPDFAVKGRLLAKVLAVYRTPTRDGEGEPGDVVVSVYNPESGMWARGEDWERGSFRFVEEAEARVLMRKARRDGIVFDEPVRRKVVNARLLRALETECPECIEERLTGKKVMGHECKGGTDVHQDRGQ